MPTTKIFIELLIENFEFSCEEIEKIIGFKPDECMSLGTKYFLKFNKKEHICDRAFMRIDSGIEPNKSLDEIFKGLLDKLRPFKKNLIPFCKKYEPDFNIIIHIYGNDSPYIGWDNVDIKEIAEYNASMGIDLSVFSEE